MAVASLCKVYMVTINILFMLTSLALIAIGVLLVFVVDMFLDGVLSTAKTSAAGAGITLNLDDFKLSDFPVLYETGVAFLVFGIVLFFLSCVGMCGSCCSQCCRFMLIVYAIAIGCVMITEITVFSMLLTKNSALHNNLKGDIVEKIEGEYDETNGNAFTVAMLMINFEGKCCGMNGDVDFGTKQHLSCKSNTNGCYDKFQNELQDGKLFIGLGIAVVLVLQLFKIVSAIIIVKDEKAKISPF